MCWAINSNSWHFWELKARQQTPRNIIITRKSFSNNFIPFYSQPIMYDVFKKKTAHTHAMQMVNVKEKHTHSPPLPTHTHLSPSVKESHLDTNTNERTQLHTLSTNCIHSQPILWVVKKNTHTPKFIDHFTVSGFHRWGVAVCSGMVNIRGNELSSHDNWAICLPQQKQKKKKKKIK